ncbi:unknown [Clostridium sp. CAG:1193]|nr:unknown [Clostridium sp. CAG:1193]
MKKNEEFNNKKIAIYFFLSMIVLIVLLFVNSISNKENKEKNDTNKNTCVNLIGDNDKYQYNVKISKDNEIIILDIKKYGDKYFIDKTEKGIITSYYIYYTKIYVSSGSAFVKYDGNILNGIDDKFLFLSYVDSMSLNSSNKVSDKCIINDEENYKICIINNNTLNVLYNDLNITYEVDALGEVKDFDVNIKEEKDNTTPNKGEDNNKK